MTHRRSRDGKRLRPCKASTLRTRRTDLISYAKKVVRLGIPIESLTSFSVLLDPEIAGRVLDKEWEQNGSEPKTSTIDLAKKLVAVARSASRSGLLDMNAAAGAQVTPENVEPYVVELKSRVDSVTVYGSIQKLRRFAQLVAPDRDLEWLIDIERQLFSEMCPRSKWDRVVYTDILEEAGLKLMAEAERLKRPKLTRARLFRNGLMVTLLARCPIRLKNFAALEIGRSFVNVDGTWWIVLTAAETKEKREDERPVPEEFTNSVERYLQVYRPILARGKNAGSALWLAMDGKPMSYASMGELITETTRMTLGVKVNPHLFRTAGVSTLATRAGDKPHAGSALLHHRRGPGAQENYNRASCITAGRSLGAVNQRYRRKSRSAD